MRTKTILLSSLVALLSSACAAELDDSTEIPQGASAITLESADAAEGLRGWLEVDGQTVDIEARRDGDALSVTLTTGDVIHAEVQIDLETGDLSGMLPAPDAAGEDVDIVLDDPETPAEPGPVVMAVSSAARDLPEIDGLEDELTALRNLDHNVVSLAGSGHLNNLQAGEQVSALSSCSYSTWSAKVGRNVVHDWYWRSRKFTTWTGSNFSDALSRNGGGYSVRAWAYCRNQDGHYFYRYGSWSSYQSIASCGSASSNAVIWGRSRARYCI